MSAIQNGEYGCTIAEMRRKPPVIIRKGQMFRCPINRGPMEPDGSGIIKCEDGINPTSIMFDSCLSAEDEELYVSDENYYLCNRHRLKGPDLPRSGDIVVACPPCERTSLEYTRKKCALDDSNDVVVHYRYYPDKTHKSVTEIDPDGEICEHWTPCQIGYIFGLPVPEQATPAKELWPGEYVPDDITSYERDEIVPPIPEDSHKEYVTTHNPYDIGLVKVSVPPGMRYSAIGKYFTGTDGSRRKDTVSTRYHVAPHHSKNIEVHVQELKNFDKVTIHFDPIEPDDIGSYYIEFEDIKHPEQPHKIVELVEFEEGTTEIIPTELITMPGRELNITEIKVNCVDCSCGQVTVRGEDGVTRQLDPKTYNFHKITDEEAEFGLYTEEASCEYFGEYFAHLTTGDTEEIVKIFTVKRPIRDLGEILQVYGIAESVNIGEPFHGVVQCDCRDCTILDIMCNGMSVMNSEFIKVVKIEGYMVHFDFPSFQNVHACVYMVEFEKTDKLYFSALAILENSSNLVLINAVSVTPPPEGEKFEQEVSYECEGDCEVETVMLNGMPIGTNTRRTESTGSIPYFVLGDHKIILRIAEYVPMLSGIEQAVFLVKEQQITKNLMEIRESILHIVQNKTRSKVEKNTDHEVTKSPKSKPSAKNVG